MAQTYAQVQRQIEALQRQAEKLRAQEITGVVERIKIAIAHYKLTAEQLGLADLKVRKAKTSKTVRTAPRTGTTTTASADRSGNTWGGRGPRPRWLREAHVEGRSVDEFAAAPASTKSKAGKEKVAGKRKVAKQYREQDKSKWSPLIREIFRPSEEAAKATDVV